MTTKFSLRVSKCQKSVDITKELTASCYIYKGNEDDAQVSQVLGTGITVWSSLAAIQKCRSPKEFVSQVAVKFVYWITAGSGACRTTYLGIHCQQYDLVSKTVFVILEWTESLQSFLDRGTYHLMWLHVPNRLITPKPTVIWRGTLCDCSQWGVLQHFSRPAYKENRLINDWHIQKCLPLWKDETWQVFFRRPGLGHFMYILLKDRTPANKSWIFFHLLRDHQITGQVQAKQAHDWETDQSCNAMVPVTL